MDEISINSNVIANTTKCYLKDENKELVNEKTVDISEWNGKMLYYEIVVMYYTKGYAIVANFK